jgi:hypothetical protein
VRRREFIVLTGGVVVAWPLAARAQQATMPVIGYLVLGAEVTHLTAAFRRGMAEAGYVEGKNLTIEYRFVIKPELMPQAAVELVRLNVNVIFGGSPEALAAARNATTTIPVVGIDLESDPIAKGYVKSLARPGGNTTGMFLDLPELSGKQVGLLKEIVPRLSHIAIFGDPGLNALQFTATETAARALAIVPEVMEVRAPDDFAGALEAARTRQIEAGILLSSPPRVPLFEASRRACASQAATPHFLVRRISKKRRFIGLWAERKRSFQKMWWLRRENPARCQAKRLADTATREVRSYNKPEDRRSVRRHRAARAARHCGRSDRIVGLLQCSGRLLSLLGPRVMSDLSPQSRPNRTLIRFAIL